MLRKELELIGVSAVSSEEKVADIADASETKSPSAETQKSKRPAPRLGKGKRQ
jgi:hypothetical protein